MCFSITGYNRGMVNIYLRLVFTIPLFILVVFFPIKNMLYVFALSYVLE